MSSPRDDAGTADWTSLDQLIDELVGLSRANTSCEAFYREALARVVEGLAAGGASVWEIDEAAAVMRMHRDALGRTTTDGRAFTTLRPAADWSLAHCEALALPPGGADADDGLPANDTEALLLVQPIVVDDGPIGVFVVEYRGDADPLARRGALRFLATAADLAADHRRNFQRSQFQRKAAAAEGLEALLSALYRRVDVRCTAYAIANDGARWCGADRVCVLIYDGKAARLVAATGVDEVDRRADSVRKLERLAAGVVAQRRSLAYPEDLASLAPQVAESLAAYIESAESKAVRIELLSRADDAAATPAADARDAESQRPFAALVLERFSEGAEIPADESVDILRRHAGRALANALDVEQIPLARFWRGLQNKRSRLTRTARTGLFVVATAALLMGAMFVIPATRWVEAPGTLLPAQRREIYAPTDAIVDEVLVGHGDEVAAGALLLRLRRPELDLEQARVLGELQTAQRRLAALRSTRTSVMPTDMAERARRQELAAEEEQLGETVRSAERQLELLAKQQGELEVRAPIAGRVTTWDPQTLLAGRPAKAGERLVRLANEQGDWLLEVKLPQHGYADVAAALKQQAAGDVEFVVAAAPETTYHGQLHSVATAADTSTDAETRMSATVAIRRDDVPPEVRKPGAIVSTRIDCGGSSLGTEWSRDFLHYLRTRWWF